MKSWLLRTAGIDKNILDATKDPQYKGFLICGTACILFFVLNFYSASYLLTFLIRDLWLDILVALLYASIVFNFYRFTLSTILWRSVDFKNTNNVQPPALFTTIIRFAACGFFIIIMSKPIELSIFHTGVLAHLPTKEDLYKDFELLHRFYPQCWLLTALFLFLFLWPLWYRSFSKKWGNEEYEKVHYAFLMRLVKIEYDRFALQYQGSFSQFDMAPEYNTQYDNPPFNTDLKEIIVNTKGKAMKEGQSKAFYQFLDTLPVDAN